MCPPFVPSVKETEMLRHMVEAKEHVQPRREHEDNATLENKQAAHRGIGLEASTRASGRCSRPPINSSIHCGCEGG